VVYRPQMFVGRSNEIAVYDAADNECKGHEMGAVLIWSLVTQLAQVSAAAADQPESGQREEQG
jgi:hypothetical protein